MRFDFLVKFLYAISGVNVFIHLSEGNEFWAKGFDNGIEGILDLLLVFHEVGSIESLDFMQLLNQLFVVNELACGLVMILAGTTDERIRY